MCVCVCVCVCVRARACVRACDISQRAARQQQPRQAYRRVCVSMSACLRACSDDHAKLIDVGLATTLGSKSRVSTKSGGAVGSNLYMSPEKGSGKSYDAKDDVWALGGMLVSATLGRAMEDMGLNTVGIFALNRAGVDDLIADARRASPELGGLGVCRERGNGGGRERKRDRQRERER